MHSASGPVDRCGRIAVVGDTDIDKEIFCHSAAVALGRHLEGDDRPRRFVLVIAVDDLRHSDFHRHNPCSLVSVARAMGARAAGGFNAASRATLAVSA